MNNIEEKRYWIWLSLIPNLGVKRKQILLEKYKDVKNIYNASKEELLKTNGIGEKLVEAILNLKIRKSVNKHLKYLQENDIDVISITDKEYPKILKKIYDPPISLYIRGNKEILNEKSIAIVGCRDATTYGKKAAKYFAYNLAKEGFNIVSGLARGIDSYSHIGCIVADREERDKIRNITNVTNSNINVKSNIGKTIAVLGNGLDTIYPTENKYLAQEIIKKGGAIISEYPLGTKPEKMNFPARNRIVSGLAKGLIVVEAKEKSGTLITVDFALEQGKDVYVVPGNINETTSVGTNELIKQGAKLVSTYMDILE